MTKVVYILISFIAWYSTVQCFDVPDSGIAIGLRNKRIGIDIGPEILEQDSEICKVVIEQEFKRKRKGFHMYNHSLLTGWLLRYPYNQRSAFIKIPARLAYPPGDKDDEPWVLYSAQRDILPQNFYAKVEHYDGKDYMIFNYGDWEFRSDIQLQDMNPDEAYCLPSSPIQLPTNEWGMTSHRVRYVACFFPCSGDRILKPVKLHPGDGISIQPPASAGSNGTFFQPPAGADMFYKENSTYVLNHTAFDIANKKIKQQQLSSDSSNTSNNTSFALFKRAAVSLLSW